jgi:ATP-binding cassette subfamily B protein
MRERTSIVVAHRLSTIRQTDRILVMESGRIREEGKHAELMEKKGLYYRLWMMQHEE